MDNKEITDSLEDYLEAIYNISHQRNFAQANQIAEYLRVGKSSVSSALRRLSRRGLVNYKPYEAITLTEKGKILAHQVARRHENIKRFLVDTLGVSDENADANACRMEHVMDRDLLWRMRLFTIFLKNAPANVTDWLKGFNEFCNQQYPIHNPKDSPQNHS